MAYYLGCIISEILYNTPNSLTIPIVCYVDNKSLWENAHSTKNVSEKRLRIDLGGIKEMIEKNQIKIEWVPTSHQLSDCFTKRGVSCNKLLEVLETGNLRMD